ncbi:MAG TPA: Ig domain-containing protein, partial [Tepidisphaeraceae bacterium]|nr:Ig domain-containing protein [Tepidisphaeraceae bacterium]
MRCLIGPCVLVLVLVLSLLIGEGFAADTAPPTPTLVKVTMRDGRVVWGELISQHGRQVTLRDLATGNEQRIGKGSIASIDQSVTDNQVAQGCGVEALAAWKTRIISQATLTSTDVGKIARIEDGAIFVTGNQAAVDDKLQVYRETQITDPDTKKLLGTDRKILADLKVTDVSAGFIKAEVVSTPNRGPKPAVGDSVRTEPEALAVAMVAGDDGPAADADKAVLNGILTRLSADDLSIVDTTQTNAAMTALHLAPADVFDSAAAQKLGQKVGASTVIVAKADASAAGSGVGVRVIDVASGQTALSVIAPPPPSLKNSSAFTLTISLHVDGKDEVDIRRDSVTVKHLQDGQPTQIKVNGVDAQVGKPLINSGSTTYLSSKADAMSGQIISKSGRGHLLLLRFHDHIAITFYDPEPGSADYSVTLQFQEKGGAPIAGIPPHPAPAPQPVNDTGTPVADLFSLVGQSGLPRYFTCDQDLISDGRGVTGGRAHTPDTDFGEKDFVLDVVFEFPDGDSRKDAIVGLGEPDHGVGVRLRLPAGDANAAMALGRRTEDAAWASFPSAGPHLLRIQKTGDSLICSMTYNFTGKYRPDALHKIDSVKDAFADMNRLDCPLYFAGDAIFTAVRLEVDGKIMSPGVAPAAIPEPAADQGWITFAPGGALPPGTVPNPKVNIAGDGLCFEEGQCLFSQLRDFTDRDFTLDLVYHFGPDDSDLLQAGLGDPGDNSHRLLAAISGPARNGHISFGHWDLEDLHRDHTGPNLVRLQKRGDTLMFAFCADYKGTFTPDITRIIPSLKAQAPFLAKLDTPVFFGGGGRIERARFLIQGEPIAPVAPPPISNQTVANLISLTGPELPSFLQPQRDLQFKGGLDLTDKRVRSARADLLANDFVADLLFMPPDGHHQAQIGLGGDDRSANANWIDKSVWVGINSPDGGGSAQLHIGHSSWDFGHYTGAGPHLLRVEKRGKTLTFSFCENFSGKFEPQFVRSVPDIRAVAPDMDPHNAFFFMDGGAIVQSMAFSVNQQPAESHDIPLALPPAVTEGQPIRVQVARLPAGSTFAADAAAPPGLSISASGQLAWTPTHAEVGPHEFQVRITTHGRTVSETVQITVVSAAD